MPIIQGTTPPRKKTPATRTTQKAQPTATAGIRLEARAGDVDGIFKTVSSIMVLRGMLADAGAINLHSKNISIEIARLAETNEQIAKALDSLTAAGPYSGVLIACLPLILQIAANHDKIDIDKAAGLGGIMSKADLEKHVEIKMQEVRAEFLAEIAASKSHIADLEKQAAQGTA
jgi:hypothetical protein